MRRQFLSAAALLSLLAGAPAGAFTMAQKCVIANLDCFPLRASASGMSPEQRIDRVNERLAYILGYETLGPNSIEAKRRSDGEVELWVGRSLLVTATWADARANGAADPQAVARVWVSKLEAALPQARPASG